jgi:chromosome segregation ATPase
LLSDYKTSIDANTLFVADAESLISKIENIEIKLNSVETQFMILDDSIQALNNYKKQLNQSILEIQTEISIMNQETEIKDTLN